MTLEINRQTFDHHLERNFQAARETLAKDPAAQLAPWVAIATVDDDPRQDDWQIHIVRFKVLDERRYDRLRALGEDYGARQAQVVATYLVSEAWISLIDTAAWAAHPENRIPPAEDPDRQESVIVIGMTATAQFAILQAMIELDAKGHAHLQEPTRLDGGSSDLLRAFWSAFTEAYLRARGQL